jgi:hypothetical protein
VTKESPARRSSFGRVWLARAIAVGADLLQIAVFPYFFEGLLSPLNAGLDIVVALALIALVGWHIAFVPTFIIEQMPFVDLAPTWTVAVLLATRRGGTNRALGRTINHVKSP